MESSVSSVCDHLRSHGRASQGGCTASHSLWQGTRVPMGSTSPLSFVTVCARFEPSRGDTWHPELTLCCCVVPEAHPCSCVRRARDETHKDEGPTQESRGYIILGSVSPLAPKSET